MGGMRAPAHLAVALAALLVIGAACGREPDRSVGGADGAGLGAAAGPTGADGAGAAAGGHGTGDRGDRGYRGYGGGAGAGAEAEGTGQVSLTVTTSGYSFSPSSFEVRAGQTIEVTNTSGSTPHTFTVPGTDLDLTLDPSGSGKVVIDLAPGTYEVVCRFHERSGMTATLTVT